MKNTKKIRTLSSYGLGGDIEEEDGDPTYKKVAKVPAGYVEDKSYIDKDNPNRKYYKLETTTTSRPSPTTAPISRKPVQGTGARTPYVGTRPAPRTSTSIDRVYMEPDATPVPAPAVNPDAAFRGEGVFGANKHLAGLISYPIKNTSNIAGSEGMVDTGAQDADFMYTKPNSDQPDVSRGRYKLSPSVIQKVLGTTNTFQDDNTDLSPYRVKQPMAKMAMGGNVNSGDGWESLLSSVPGILNGVMSLTDNTDYSRQPIMNASAIRNMATPYSSPKMAMGGSIDDLDDDEMQALQEKADEMGMEPEELYQQLMEQQQGGGEEEQQDDEEQDNSGLLGAFSGSDEDGYAYGGTIHIKAKNKGKFNALKKKTGKSTEQLTHSSNPLTRKRAVFAQNAKKWHHAMGGNAGSNGISTANKRAINVEGGEVIQTPGNAVQKVKGPKHEKGGVDLVVPSRTKIFSDRLAIDGKDMKDRKLAREAQLTKLQKLLGTDPTSKLLQNTVKRTTGNLHAEEAQDMALQNTANKIYAPPQEDAPTHAYGGDVKGYAYGGDDNILTPRSQYENYGFDPQFNNPGGNTAIMPNSMPTYTGPAYKPASTVPLAGAELTAGDYLGMAGTAFGAVAPIINTINDRNATKPNINRYADFGHNALSDNDAAEGYVAGMRSNAQTNAETSSNSRYRRNANSALSVNTQRALDATTDMETDRTRTGIDDSYGKEMIGILGNRSQLDNIRDAEVDKGATMRDNEDKADTDNFYTNMGANLSNFGRSAQTMGRNLNIGKSNRVDAELISQLSLYGLEFDDNGKLVNKKS